jgi:hypothetical protein
MGRSLSIRDRHAAMETNHEPVTEASAGRAKASANSKAGAEAKAGGEAKAGAGSAKVDAGKEEGQWTRSSVKQARGQSLARRQRLALNESKRWSPGAE